MDEMRFTSEDIAENRTMAAIAYLWLLFLIPMFFRRKSPFAQAHAKQGLVLFLVQALSSLLVWIAIVGPLWNLCIVFLVPLAALVRTLGGHYWNIPLIGNYAQKLSFE